MAVVIPISSIESRQNTAGRADTKPVDAFLGRLSPASQRGFQIALRNIAAIVSDGKDDAHSLDWAALRYADTAKVREVLMARFATRTANYGISALRGVLKECWRLGLMSHEDYSRAVDLAQIRGDNTAAGRVLTHTELANLIGACLADESAAGARDAAIISVLYGTGLRRAELVALNRADYNSKDGVLTVKGKGNTVRLAYVVNAAKELLEDWMKLRMGSKGAVFVSVNKGGEMSQRRLTGGSVFQILNRRAVEAGVEPFSPHDLRRSAATHLLCKGVDISVVKRMLGHKNLSTTLIYDRRGESAKRNAAQVLHFRT
jgi:site-specific recombinase XerD